MDIYSAEASRDVAMKELFLLERHHLGTPDARCKECEVSHQMTASALMSEASRMNDGTAADLNIAKEIDNLDFSGPQRDAQQRVRKIRKKIMTGEGIPECTKTTCAVVTDIPKNNKEEILISNEENNKEDYTWLYVLGGAIALLLIAKSRP